MRPVEAVRDGYLDRFCMPHGDPDVIRRLSWRRSALRLQILLTLNREQPHNELSFIVEHLNRAPERARHRVLASPEVALYVSNLVNGTIPDSEITVPVLTRIASVSSDVERAKFSWAGALTLDYLPVGERALRMRGGTIKDPELVLQRDRIRICSAKGDGPVVEVPANTSERLMDNYFVRADKLEIVDGWQPFADGFDDGNLSVAFDDSSRVEFLRLLGEAVELIRVVMPAALEEMVETAQYLSPIRPQNDDANTLPSFSSPALPGVIFVGVEQGDGRMIDVKHLAESCVHEHLHNRLYLLDEALPLTVKTDNPRSYFSPWKQTMRPIEGMLHAVYVFSRLAWFWRKAGESFDDLTQYATDSIAEQAEQIKSATAEIDTAELTPAGCRILSSSMENLDLLTPAI